MLRKTLTILFLIGLLLSLWMWGMSFGDGGLSISPNNYTYCADGQWTWYHKNYPNVELDLHWFQYGFREFSHHWLPAYEPSKNGWRIDMPSWIPTLLFASLFLITYLSLHRHHRNDQRKKLGLCLKCGYDLRASKDRCPECGTSIASSGV